MTAPFPSARLTAEQWVWTTHLLACRSGALCEGCGRPFVPGAREANRHHRRGGKAGGTVREDHNSLANLLLLCAGPVARLGGVAGCHGRVGAEPGWAARRGLIVREGEDPAAVALVLASGRRVLLDPVSPLYLPAPGPAYQLDEEPG